MAKKILQQTESVLRKIAPEVPLDDIPTPKVQAILKEMSLALATQSDGVAIAAPQIGYSLRIFAVAGKIFETDFLKNREERMKDRTVPKVKIKTAIKDIYFINPKILKLSRKKEWMPEGCLSVRPWYGKTHRATKALVEAYDENGNKFTRGGSGLLAQIFQHETDHLDGILFIDHAKDLREEELSNGKS